LLAARRGFRVLLATTVLDVGPSGFISLTRLARRGLGSLSTIRGGFAGRSSGGVVLPMALSGLGFFLLPPRRGGVFALGLRWRRRGGFAIGVAGTIGATIIATAIGTPRFIALTAASAGVAVIAPRPAAIPIAIVIVIVPVFRRRVVDAGPAIDYDDGRLDVDRLDIHRFRRRIVRRGGEICGDEIAIAADH
jgi:hypothetical protein